MKIFVTGGDGLLGSNLVRLLLERGDSVRALAHPASRSTTLDGLPVEVIKGDLLDAATVNAACADCEAAAHVAAATAMWPAQSSAVWKVNVLGTRNVLAAAERNKIRRLIHVGSASSFGYGTKESPGDESSPYAYDGFGLAYFDSKLEAQRMVLDCVREGKLDAVVVNPTFMFGAYDSGPSSGRMIVRFNEIRPQFYPPGGRCFIHARDAAAGIISALERGRSGECYILGHENLEMRELLCMIAEIIGYAKPKLQIPEAAMKIAGVAGTLYGTLSGKTPELSIEIARSGCLGTYYSAAKAVRELALPQTPARVALEDSVKWLGANGYLKRRR